MNVMKSCRITTSTITLTLLLGCATIVGQSGTETLNVRSTPDVAKVLVKDEAGMKVYVGETPAAVLLSKKRGFFKGKKYTVTVSKEGYLDREVIVDTRLNGWYIGGNIIFGGLIGWLIVDPATGAMWTLDIREIAAELKTIQGTALEHDKTGIVPIQEVPSALQDNLVPVTP